MMKHFTGIPKRLLLVCLLFPLRGVAQPPAKQSQPESPRTDYENYYRVAARAEERIAHRAYEEALTDYRQLVAEYDVVFVREYKIAAQLALLVGRTDEAFTYLKRGIQNGWTLKSIRKNPFLRKLRADSNWQDVKQHYPAWREAYRKRINSALREDVKKLFRRDQWKAFRALFALGQRRQITYTEKKFAPHSEKQVRTLTRIIETYGYPGEKSIGNSFWAAVILSHHNSISRAYALTDTLYPRLKPLLLRAIQSGEMSPYEFAMIDGWSISIKQGQPAFGYLTGTLTGSERDQANQLRRAIQLSSVEIINQLIDVQKQTGMNLYLPASPGTPTQKKIVVK